MTLGFPYDYKKIRHKWIIPKKNVDIIEVIGLTKSIEINHNTTKSKKNTVCAKYFHKHIIYTIFGIP